MESKLSLGPSVAKDMAAGGAACVSHDELALRAATDADLDFLREVFSSTRVDEFVQAGMPIDQVQSLLASQFSIQHDYYQRHYPNGRFDVILHQGHRVGRLYHDWNGEAAQLIDIALLPAYRGAGMGTRLVRSLVAEAAQRRMPMRLYVEFNNPVRSLYGRLGFVPAGENGVYELMHRVAAPLDDGQAVAPLQGLNEQFQ